MITARVSLQFYDGFIAGYRGEYLLTVAEFQHHGREHRQIVFKTEQGNRYQGKLPEDEPPGVGFKVPQHRKNESGIIFFFQCRGNVNLLLAGKGFYFRGIQFFKEEQLVIGHHGTGRDREHPQFPADQSHLASAGVKLQTVKSPLQCTPETKQRTAEIRCDGNPVFLINPGILRVLVIEGRFPVHQEQGHPVHLFLDPWDDHFIDDGAVGWCKKVSGSRIP